MRAAAVSRLGAARRAPGARGAQLVARAYISTSSTEKILKLDPLNPSLSSYRRTKIVCTIGPASWVRVNSPLPLLLVMAMTAASLLYD
jgi:hypothetical protein